MKKILAYIFAAVLLGTVTMLAPFTLFVSGMLTQTKLSQPSIPDFNTQRAIIITEQAYGITPVTYPLDFLFIAFMPALSLAIALGVMCYFKRKLLSNI